MERNLKRSLNTLTALLLSLLTLSLMFFTGCEGNETDRTDILLGGMLAGAVIIARSGDFIAPSNTAVTTGGTVYLSENSSGQSGTGSGDSNSGTSDTDTSTDSTSTALLPSTPSAPDPADSASEQTLPVLLKWTGGDPSPLDTAVHDVYLDTVNPPVRRISNSQYDTSYRVFNLETGQKYYWKIVTRDSLGQETEGPVWSFSTVGYSAPETKYPPNTPTNPSPQDKSSSQPTSPTLSWTGGDKNSSEDVFYDVYMDTTDSPVTRVGAKITATSLNIPGLNEETTYYWKVFAEDSSGLTAESSVWSFTTGNGSLANVPSNPSPADGSSFNSSPDHLQWQGDSSNGETTYTVYLSLQGEALSELGTSMISQWSLTNQLGEGTYTWKVIATDLNGKASEGSLWTFKIDPAVDTEYTLIPNDGFTAAGPLTTLSWSSSLSSQASATTLTLSKNSDMSDSNTFSLSEASSLTLTDLLDPGTTYFWKLQQNFTSDQSNVFSLIKGPYSFTTLDYNLSMSGSAATVPTVAINGAIPNFAPQLAPADQPTALSSVIQGSGSLLLTIVNPGASSSDTTLQRMVSRYAAKTQEIAVITIPSGNYSSADGMTAYAQSLGITWYTGLDRGEAITRYFQKSAGTALGAEDFPVAALIDSSGVVKSVSYGELSEETVADLIK